MIKDFIPQYECQQLKALGFDENCIAYRWDPTYTHPDNLEVNCERIHWTPMHIQNHNLLPTRISAITYAQAFKWFRKRFKFATHIDLKLINHLGEEYYYKIVNFLDFVDESTTLTQDGFETYEDAEQACLEKLIKFLK